MAIKNPLAIGLIAMIGLLGASTAPAEAGCCKFLKELVKPIERAGRGLGHAIKGTIEVIGDTLETTYDIGESMVDGTVSVVEAIGNGGEALVMEATGNRKRAIEAWKDAEKHAQDAVEEVASAVEETVKAPYEVLKGGASVVRDDFVFTFVLGKHPDDVRAEIRTMVAECKARIAAQRELPSDTDAVGEGELLPFPAIFLSDAVEVAASVLYLFPGSPQLREEYDAAVATCNRAYEDAHAKYIEKVKFVISEKNAVEARLTAAVQQFWALAKIRVAARFGRSISDEELQPRLSEHPDLAVDMVAFVQQESDIALARLECYDRILGDSDLLRRFGEEDTATLCQEVG